MTDPRPRFPGRLAVVGGLALAAGYLPTLAAPFDFIDDGNLVYPAPPGTTFAGHVGLWWAKVRANVDHLGPFRPTLWAHWEVFANLLGGSDVGWRAVRLGWCALAGMSLLWLLRSLNLPPAPALLAAGFAMWNPYRNEIWTSLTLAEGVAMPYALAALAAARTAAHSRTPWKWDVLSVGCVAVALGCKNTFAALVPAQLALRLLADGSSLGDGWRRGRVAAGCYLVPLAMPAAHFVYFKLNWHPGQYETPGPSVGQLVRFARWMRGAVGLDFLAPGLVLAGLAAWHGAGRRVVAGHRAAVVAAGLLLAAGTAVYLPLPMVAARYTMPAVWGADILVAVLLAAVAAAAPSRLAKAAWAAVAVGLAATTAANVGRQERVAARARLLWQVAHHLEREAPRGAVVLWVSGKSGRGELNVEEGIHMAWHLAARGRGDIRVALADAAGGPVSRVELPPVADPPDFRLAAGPAADAAPPGWVAAARFAVPYRFGRKAYVCRLDAAPKPAPAEPGTPGLLPFDPLTQAVMRAGFADPAADAPTLIRRASHTEPAAGPADR